MAGITFAQFLYGEIGQESGGNYAARSPAGALGKYQILESNIPSWSKEILGHSITPEQFMASPQLQDQIAFGKLKQYFDQYGPEGAASAWYTGNPDAWKTGGGGDNYGGPSAAGYVQSVMARADGYRGDGSDLTFNHKPLSNGGVMAQSAGATPLTSGGSTTGGAAAPTADDYKSALGDMAGVLAGIPELRGVLSKAVQGGWAVSKFQQAVQATNWYKTHNAAARQLAALYYSDRSEYTARMQASANQVKNVAAQLGVNLNPAQLKTLANQFIIQGWDQQSLTQQVGKSFNPQDANAPLSGNIATAYQQMKQMYADYGVPVSEATLRDNALKMAEGVNTLDAYKQNALASAKSLYPSLSSQLDTGLTVKDIADPYRQTMANLLELDPNSLTVNDPLIKRALQGSITQQGDKATATSTPLWQFEQQLRSDPRWGQTNNARDTVSSALLQVGAAFGFGPKG